ncbi:hypothetical protein [Luteimonas sp. MHLX1A]|uniref:hypothetical protein n=1 Tax=Alterluteimonas muca TaxID=2878684 RepID=UPI001E614A2C|nr:hypothetical protein [Luteimonas sp. MHLX1A]MCD9046836.1 hypothetical protein [Luteimonas sp. MHLX1A]
MTNAASTRHAKSQARLERRLQSIVRPAAFACSGHAPGETGFCRFESDVAFETALYAQSTVDALLALLRDAQRDITHLTIAYGDACARAAAPAASPAADAG